MTKRLSKMSVADYITLQLEACGKPQFEIAEQAGFEKPNVITMIKQGKTKLPLAKIGPMARALGVDPVYLYQITMEEYLPETWEAIQSIFAHEMPTKNEAEVIDAMRSAGLGTKALSGDQKRDLIKFLKTQLPQDE